MGWHCLPHKHLMCLSYRRREAVRTQDWILVPVLGVSRKQDADRGGRGDALRTPGNLKDEDYVISD